MRSREIETVYYNGQNINKSHFRVYVYNAKKESKLVNSWDEYELHMQTGLWFAEIPEVTATAVKETVTAVLPKKKKASKDLKNEEPLIEEELIVVPAKKVGKDDFLSEAK